MDISNLKLLIEKGPREGETIEFNSKPGLTIRIGRVVRGNTIALKDDGVSSKHLSIEWCSEGKWAVKDLDSSNGTFLNSSALLPHTVHDLRDGDELKIGEVTKIRVRISQVSDSQPAGRVLRSRARDLGAESLDDGKKVAEEGNRRGRGRGRGRDRGKGDANLGEEPPASIASVATEVNKEGNVLKEENGKGRGRGRGRSRGKGNAVIGDGELGSEVSASIVSANSEVDVESNVRDVGVRRGRSREKKGANSEDEPKLHPEISENVESVTQKGRSVSSRRTRSSKNDKAGEVECKAEPVSSLRRSTRSRGIKSKDELAFPSALERIPEASQLVSSMNFEQLENVSAAEKLNARTRRGRKKNEVEMSLHMASAQSVAAEDKGSEEEHIEGEQVSRESMDNIVEEGERLASGLISENCNELESVVVKPEPQSNIGGIVGKGESVSEIAQKDGDLACELNFEHENVEEELEPTLNRDDRRDSECNVGATVSQESTADASEKEAEAEVQMGLQIDSPQSVAVEDTGSEEEHNEGGQIPRESMHIVSEEGKRLASGLISGQENCNELEFVVVKPEPQSNIGGLVGKGESMREIAQKDGDLACELNFEHETVEELEATLNQDDRRESECNVGPTVSQESTADASEKEAEAEIAADLNKMTLGEWFDHLERYLPKQIRSETDQIIQDMANRSQQLHEFMLQQQKDKGTPAP